MSSNICGNCENFKPKPGEKLFNCTHASHAGLKYGMQVRPDTRSCDAFVPLEAAPPPRTPPAGPTPMPTKEVQRPVALCSRGRMILMVTLAIAVLLVSWLLYTCASALITTETTPTPTPAPTVPPGPTASPGPVGPLTPTPSPTPGPWEHLELGEWMRSDRELVTIADADRKGYYKRYGVTNYAPTGTWFIIIDVSFTNVGTSPLPVGPNQFALVDSAGLLYLEGGYDAEDALPTRDLYRGKTVGGKLLFTVPKPVSGLEVYHTMRGTPSVRATWQLPW